MADRPLKAAGDLLRGDYVAVNTRSFLVFSLTEQTHTKQAALAPNVKQLETVLKRNDMKAQPKLNHERELRCRKRMIGDKFEVGIHFSNM